MKRALVIIVILLLIAAGLYVAARRHLISIPGLSPDVHIAATTTPEASKAVATTPDTPKAAPAPKGVTFRIEKDVNRQASDYRDFEMAAKDGVDLCQKACADETKCVAFTYVKAGPRGAKPHCWLKNTVPQAYSDDQCITGVKE